MKHAEAPRPSADRLMRAFDARLLALLAFYLLEFRAKHGKTVPL